MKSLVHVQVIEGMFNRRLKGTKTSGTEIRTCQDEIVGWFIEKNLTVTLHTSLIKLVLQHLGLKQGI